MLAAARVCGALGHDGQNSGSARPTQALAVPRSCQVAQVADTSAPARAGTTGTRGCPPDPPFLPRKQRSEVKTRSLRLSCGTRPGSPVSGTRPGTEAPPHSGARGHFQRDPPAADEPADDAALLTS